jgi:hypothetical protein
MMTAALRSKGYHPLLMPDFVFSRRNADSGSSLLQE